MDGYKAIANTNSMVKQTFELSNRIFWMYNHPGPNQTNMKFIRTLTKQNSPVSFAGETFRRYYFENAVSCGECNGAGCKRCYPRHGVESFWEFNYVRRTGSHHERR